MNGIGSCRFKSSTPTSRVIDPDGLLQHARRLAGEGRGRPPDADLHRGTSAAYYAIFRDLTERAASHLIGSSPDPVRSAIRSTRKHGDLKWLASQLVERSRQLTTASTVPPPRSLEAYGPLADVAANDSSVVEGLRRFVELQELRHRADHDHEARIDKSTLLQGCEDADHVWVRLNDAGAASTEALFTMLAVKRTTFDPVRSAHRDTVALSSLRSWRTVPKPRGTGSTPCGCGSASHWTAQTTADRSDDRRPLPS